LPHNVFLVADNASVHDEVAISLILSTKNITLVKLPAYSYDLNHIEMVFAQEKAIARFSPGALSQDPMLQSLPQVVETPFPFPLVQC